jgi:hypothetical protein
VLAKDRCDWNDAAASKRIGDEELAWMILREGIRDRAVNGFGAAGPPAIDADRREMNLTIPALDPSGLTNRFRIKMAKRRTDRP